MSIFYSYSNHKDTSSDTFHKISKKITNIIDTDNPDINNSNELLDKILNHLENSDLFICDMTPDNIIEDKPIYNPNVILELGYALKIFRKSNIIIILNTFCYTTLPSMLNGFYILNYDSRDKNYENVIIKEIKARQNNMKEYNKDWITKKYNLSERFINNVKILLDVKMINYNIRVHKKNKQVVILFHCNGGYNRILNVINKQLIMKKKEICLSNYKEIYDEINHLELIANINWFS